MDYTKSLKLDYLKDESATKAIQGQYDKARRIGSYYEQDKMIYKALFRSPEVAQQEFLKSAQKNFKNRVFSQHSATTIVLVTGDHNIARKHIGIKNSEEDQSDDLVIPSLMSSGHFAYNWISESNFDTLADQKYAIYESILKAVHTAPPNFIESVRLCLVWYMSASRIINNLDPEKFQYWKKDIWYYEEVMPDSISLDAINKSLLWEHTRFTRYDIRMSLAHIEKIFKPFRGEKYKKKFNKSPEDLELYLIDAPYVKKLVLAWKLNYKQILHKYPYEYWEKFIWVLDAIKSEAGNLVLKSLWNHTDFSEPQIIEALNSIEKDLEW